MDKYREEIESNINGVNEYINRQLKMHHSQDFINRIMKKIEVIRNLSVEYGVIVGTEKLYEKLALQENEIYTQKKKIKELEKDLEVYKKRWSRLQKNTTSK
ncbi:hypothetical protein [Amedibacillus dolichus]|nr:hypothetical protein [Amedibacillus dolichus]